MGFATRQIHAGKHDNGVGALCTPIYQTSTFEFDTVQQGGARFAGQEEGYIYSRLGNPSLTQVEEKLAALEGGEAALATASGMGAISSALWSSVEAGDEIVASDTLYGCTFALLNHGMSKFGVGVKFVDFADLAAVKAALTEKTKLVPSGSTYSLRNRKLYPAYQAPRYTLLSWNTIFPKYLSR